MNPILVTCYVNPDLDGVAGVVAYAEYLNKTGKNAVAGIFGEPHEEAKYVIKQFDIPHIRQIDQAKSFEQVILVDASDLTGLEGNIEPDKVVEIIDHRKVHEADKFPNAKTQIELVGAAATLVAERFMTQKIAISRESAILLHSAIISNTLNFKAGVTTGRDKAVAEWLSHISRLPIDFWKDMFRVKSDLSGKKLADRLENDFASFVFDKNSLGICQIEMLGAKDLINSRSQEIAEKLKQIKNIKQLDFIFLNLIDLEQERNFFVSGDQGTRNLLYKIFGVKFEGNIATRPGMLMRKEITPMIRAELMGGKRF